MFARGRSKVWLGFVLSLALLLAACGPGPGAPDDNGALTPPVNGEEPQENGTSQQEPNPLDRPETIDGSIDVEGMPQPVTLHLLAAPAHWPLAFTTYYPEDLVPENIEVEAGSAIALSGHFGGVRNEDVVVTIFAFSEGTAGERARQTAAEIARNRGLETMEPSIDGLSWARDLYGDMGARSRHGGWLALGEKDGHWFYVYTQYPLEAADGVSPRAQLILREWLWSDDGTSLIPASADEGGP